MHHTDIEDLAAMVESYLRTALWTWTDGDGHAPYGATAGDVDVRHVFDLRAIVQATDDCRSFCEYVEDVATSGTVDTAARQALADMDPAQAGADFWLTREGHGTGFWDRGLDRAGDCLADAARTFGDGGFDVIDGKATLS
jgi:hypothetical protein